MHILYILKSFAQLAGTERVMADKINYLANHGFCVSLITYEQGNHSLAFPLNKSVDHIDLDTRFFTLSKYPIYTRFVHYIILKHTFRKKLQTIIEKKNPNIIITTTYSLKISKDILKVKKNAKVIIESHVSHDSVIRHYDYSKGSILRYLAMLYDYNNIRSIKQFDYFVALTQKDANQWRKHLTNVIVIPNPVTKYPDVLTKNKQTKYRIIAVGRLNHQKGFDKLIDAFSLISEKYPLWHIDIFGQGELYEVLCSQIEKYSLKDRIIIRQPTPNIYEEYLNSDFYVLSSNFEGFGLVIIEAMACGLPVVSFDCPYGPDEIITNNKDGILVPKQNTALLAHSMERLIENENERNTMATEARLTAKKYIIENIMQQWKRLFFNTFK